MEIQLQPGERLDDLQRNGYKIIQNEKLFCFGMDAVLLSAFARVREGEDALDLGTGTGVIPILLEARTRGRSLPDLRSAKRALIWRGGACSIIIWSIGYRSLRAI